MNGYEFERSLVELFVEFTQKKGLKAKPLAVSAWPDRKDAGTKWRKIRNGDAPRELTVRDAYDLSLALGVSFTEMCGIVQGRATEAEMLRHSELEASQKKEATEKQASYPLGSILPDGASSPAHRR